MIADASSGLVTDRATMRSLEGLGFGLGAVLFDDPDAVTTSELSRHALYGSYVDWVRKDVAEAAAGDSAAGTVFSGDHRVFDTRVLSSRGSSFELVGVVNRMDRRFALPGSCGEVRFVYRVGYPESLEPLTLNVIFKQPAAGGACSSLAQTWRQVRGEPGAPLARALAAGPLERWQTPANRKSDLVQVETNFQVMRWPTTLDTLGDIGGLGLYVLRVFRPEGDTFVPRPLENTPDVGVVRSDPAKKRMLVDWLKASRAERDSGRIVRIPAELESVLATKVISVAPRSFDRLANRPFSQILDAADLAELGANTPGERERVLRKLDTGTCNGCHQTRSVAGFHLLGEDLSFGDGTRSDEDWLNKIAVGRSPHLLDENALRVAEVARIASGENPPSRAPTPERAAPGRSTLHTHCGIANAAGQVDPAFAGWSCGAGQVCDALDPAAVVGSCEVARAGRVGAIGDACEIGHTTSSANPKTDTFAKTGSRECAPPDVDLADPRGPRRGVCAASHRNGFPGGACYLGCSSIGRVGNRGEAICTGVPSDVQPCTMAGKRLLTCIVETAVPGWVQTCDEDRPCREEYACARVKSTAPGTGACMPPYFLQQIRNDGHVLADDPCAQKRAGPHCMNARHLVECDATGHTMAARSKLCAKSCVQGKPGTVDACSE